MRIIMDLPDAVCMKCGEREALQTQRVVLIAGASADSEGPIAKDGTGAYWQMRGAERPSGWLVYSANAKETTQGICQRCVGGLPVAPSPRVPRSEPVLRTLPVTIKPPPEVKPLPEPEPVPVPKPMPALPVRVKPVVVKRLSAAKPQPPKALPPVPKPQKKVWVPPKPLAVHVIPDVRTISNPLPSKMPVAPVPLPRTPVR